jgi:hypothetical protein
MKKILGLLLFSFLFACPSQATFTITKLVADDNASTVSNTNCGGSGTGLPDCYSVAITGTSGAGLFVSVLQGSTSTTLSACDDGGDSFTLISGMVASGSGGATSGCWTGAQASGRSNVYVGVSTLTTPTITVYQMVFTNGPLSLDNSGTAADSSTTTPKGIAPSLSGTNDVVFQVGVCAQTCGTPCATNYTCDFTAGDYTAYYANNISSTQPTFAQSPTGTAQVAYAAFKEAGAAAPSQSGKAVIY